MFVIGAVFLHVGIGQYLKSFTVFTVFNKGIPVHDFQFSLYYTPCLVVNNARLPIEAIQSIDCAIQNTGKSSSGMIIGMRKEVPIPTIQFYFLFK